jgi:antirestriction protein ArdC
LASRRRPATTTPPKSPSWLKVLKDDKQSIFTAASNAQTAIDYLHALHKGPRLGWPGTKLVEAS